MRDESSPNEKSFADLPVRLFLRPPSRNPSAGSKSSRVIEHGGILLVIARHHRGRNARGRLSDKIFARLFVPCHLTLTKK